MADTRPIRTETGYQAALARIEELMDAGFASPDGRELDMLVDRVELYESRKEPMGHPSPVAAIQFRMEQAGLQPHDLIPVIGSHAGVSQVLSGERPITTSMARALQKHLGTLAESGPGGARARRRGRHQE